MSLDLLVCILAASAVHEEVLQQASMLEVMVGQSKRLCDLPSNKGKQSAILKAGNGPAIKAPAIKCCLEYLRRKFQPSTSTK